MRNRRENDVPRPRRNVNMQTFDSEAVLYVFERTEAIYLSETATLIWKLCDGERTIREIIQVLRQAFPDKACQIPSDVKSTIRLFDSHGLLN